MLDVVDVSGWSLVLRLSSRLRLLDLGRRLSLSEPELLSSSLIMGGEDNRVLRVSDLVMGPK